MDNENSGYAGQVARNKPGATLEPDTDGKTQPAGLWRHPLSGAEVITQNDPLWGDGQGRAAARTGFVYVGPAPEGSVKTLADVSVARATEPERKLEADAEELKGLRARLNALEAAQVVQANAVAAGTPVPGTEPVKGADATMQAAANKTEEQTGAAVDPATGSFRELQAQAKDLGVSAKGSKDDLTQRVADAKAEKESE